MPEVTERPTESPAVEEAIAEGATKKEISGDEGLAKLMELANVAATLEKLPPKERPASGATNYDQVQKISCPR